MANIPIRDIPGAVVASPDPSNLIPMDNGSLMQKTTIANAVNTALPLASQPTAEAGVNNSDRMSSLRTKQAIDAQVPTIVGAAITALNLGTMSQEESSDYTPTSGLAAVALSNDYADLSNLPTLGTAAATDASDYATAAQAVPIGGTTGQVLAKASGTDNDVVWTAAGVGDMLSAIYDPTGREEDIFAALAARVPTSALQTTITDDDAKVPTSGAVVDYVASRSALIQYVYDEYTDNTNLTTVIPFDDTIPQISEGTEVLSVEITPSSASSKVIIRGQVTGATDGPGAALSLAVFVNGGADAIFADANIITTANHCEAIAFEFEHSPASTAPQTYSVRVGPSGGTARLNGVASGRRFGGVMKSTLIAEERRP